MIEPTSRPTGDWPPVERLRAELAQGDRVLESSGAILHHLLSHETLSSFSDEIVARMRGMVHAIADQLHQAMAGQAQASLQEDQTCFRQGGLYSLLIENHALLGHLQTLAMEWQLAQKLDAQTGLDPDYSPLLQALIASEDETMASTAVAMLASQVRFTSHLRRMELPLRELPGDLFHLVLLCMRNCTDGPAEEAAARVADKDLRAAFDESHSRISLSSQLVTAMGAGAMAALDLGHAGAPLFFSALAILSGQPRAGVIMATTPHQMPRLALALRATGMKPAMVERQFAVLHPACKVPETVLDLSPEQASAILAESPLVMGS